MTAPRTRLLARSLGVGALWAGSGLVVGLLLASAAPLALGDGSYVVRSGSMAPAIEPGDVIVARPIDPLRARVGQIVTFKDPNGSGRLLSHRARAVHRAGDHVSFVTQGDANTGQERWSVPIDGRIGQVLYRIPKLGYALVWTQRPVGQIGLIVVPAMLLAAFSLARIWKPRRPALAPTRRRADTRCAGAVLACIALSGLAGSNSSVWATFSDNADNADNQITARPDWVAPTAAASVIGKSQGGTPGFIRQGGTYDLYANVSDTGNPPSGIATVNGNLSSVTSGLTGTPLSSGSFSIGGAGYSYRGASLTAKATLAAGTYTYTMTAADSAGNSRTQTGFSVVVDNTAPTASGIQTTNKSGNTAGAPEMGDTIVFTNSEQLDPYLVLAGWAGALTNVVVRINDNADATDNNDQVRVYNAANTSQLPLGTINLGRNDYVFANASFGVTGTPSTMVQTGATITVTLGTASAGTRTAGFSGTMIWSPSATATDRAGNPETATTRAESGTSDKDF